ncbi:MAG: sulfatase-like hydrolase/transferase, partial [Acidobacteriota bacterium]
LADLGSAPAWPDKPARDRTGADFVAALGAGLVVSVVYAARGWVTGSHEGFAAGFGAMIVVHAVAAAALFLVLTAIRGIAASRRFGAARREFWLTAALVVGVFELLMLGVILPSLSVATGSRTVAAAVLGFALAFVAVARGRHRRAPSDDGVQTALAAFVPGLAHTTGVVIPALAWLTLVTVVGTGFATASGVMDWSFVLARIGAFLTWLLAASGALALPSPSLRRPTSGWAFGWCLATLAAHQLLVPPPGLAAGTPVDRYAVVDPSFRMLREALRPPTPTDPNFYPFLQKNTNLGRDVDIKPIDVTLARLEGPLAPRRPHIFLFVIDSLRRDYVSPYNPAVTFTPAIGRFAAENVAFERVFTRYGATGLSVPSIWVGGMILHKQYVQPFAPMNSLYKLLAHEDYTSWLSRDNIVDAIVPHDHEGPALDTTRAIKDFRFCDTAAEITTRLDSLKPDGPPVFAWALPQDIHISAITREGAATIDDGDYGAFYKPYASRMKRIDTCFGQFVDGLKARGLYDDSVVILTADHGDSLGEEGRWGHAYTLFPEILQVPLIMHVPAWFRASHDTDPRQLAFTTDITPTLYAMLGFEPARPAPVFGQPLFWAKGQPQPVRPGEGHLLASSYGSVYGWLTGEGHKLYVADGVDFRDYQFTLDGSQTGHAQSVGSADRQQGQKAIHDAVEGIATFYKFSSSP